MDLLPKMQIEIVVDDTLKDQVTTAIIKAARTGKLGMGG